jgi:dihydrofolate reductase
VTSRSTITPSDGARERGGRLLYSMSVSLDGYAAAADGSLDWVFVDEELHAAFNEEGRSADTFLYGRRMYELMADYWPTAEDDPDATPTMLEFAGIWNATPKVVFSRTLDAVEHGARLVRDDAVGEVARLKGQGLDMGVGGPTLAGSLLRAGLVDEVRAFVNPILLGAGVPFLPHLEVPVPLRLIGTRTFASGVVLLRYDVAG